jgi:lipopolysaccharide biosynthesis glycosyltransferase
MDNFPRLGEVKAYITKATYYRLFISDILPESVHKIIYMDGDIIVRHSLKDLWETDITKYAVGAVTDMAEAKHDFKRLGYDSNKGYFNAGVLLINVDYWREHHLKDAFMDLIIDEPQRIVLHDQDVLNITLHDYKYNLPMKYNVQNGFLWKSEYNQFGDKYSDYESDLKEAISDPVVVHFTDNKKPWHYEDCNPYGYEFTKYKKQTEWRYSPLTHCYKNKYRHFIANVLRTFHLIQPTKTQEYLYLPLEVIIGKK